MKADAKLVYFFQKNKFCLLQIEKKLLFFRVRDWKGYKNLVRTRVRTHFRRVPF